MASEPNQELFARVVIDSNLPQLSREFEYTVPPALFGTIAVGSEVEVPFGRSKAKQVGYVVALSTTKEYDGIVNEITAVRSRWPMLPAATYDLLRTLAHRQSCSIADLIRLALPARAATVEKVLETAPCLFDATSSPATTPTATHQRQFLLADPTLEAPGSMMGIFESAMRAAQDERSARGGSLLILVPDERAVDMAVRAAKHAGVEPILYVSNLTRVARFRAWARVQREQQSVVIATRSGAYLPICNLQRVIMWDDSDASYSEPTAPYLHTREVVLQRQSAEGFALSFAGNSISSDSQRLIEIGYLDLHSMVSERPALAISDDVSRINSLAFRAIRESIDANRPVLVQVASRGAAVSTFCRTCQERISCKACHGPIGVNHEGKPACRWCNAIQLQVTCASCGGRDFGQGRAGATRTVAELGRSFAGARVIESSTDNPVLEIAPGKTIVVATPGAEPFVAGGYGAVALLDGANLLSRDSLRAREEALRLWSNAIAYLGPGGRATLTGVAGPTAQRLCLWQQQELARAELAERRELGFPPAVRLASVTTDRQNLAKLQEQLAATLALEPFELQVLGPIDIRADRQVVADEARLLIKYPYAATLPLADALKQAQLDASVASKAHSSRSGRAVRPLRVRMDETQVI